jgi:hypothetical protein
MLWPKGNPAAADLVDLVVCLQEDDGVPLRVVVSAVELSQIPEAEPWARPSQFRNRLDSHRLAIESSTYFGLLLFLERQNCGASVSPQMGRSRV